MNMSVPVLLAFATIAGAVHGGVSQPVDLVASPSSVYMTTLLSSRPTLRCAWPRTAAAANLSVTGRKFSATRSIVRGEGEIVLVVDDVEFPVAATHEDEHLYTLELTFRDAGDNVCGTRIARLANARGGQGGTRVLATDDLESTAWQKVRRKNVLIPIVQDGVDEVTLQKGANDAYSVPAGLDGNRGWFEWVDLAPGFNTFTAGGDTAMFLCLADGTCIIIR